MISLPQNTRVLLVVGDALEILKRLPTESIDMVITSPPYWALRDYGNSVETIWDAQEGCEHEWNNYEATTMHENRQNLDGGTLDAKETQQFREELHGWQKSNAGFCQKCGAWKGQLGLEPTFDLYIKHLCDIFDEVKRAIKKTGTCWVNLGDTYGGSGNASGHKEDTTNCGKKTSEYGATKGITQRLMPKCLLMIPFRFAIEMVNRGWILRNTIIWHKPNCMPSSVKDRFTVDFEYLFFFSKTTDYYFETQLEAWQDRRPSDIQRAIYGSPEYKGKYASNPNNNSAMSKSHCVGDPRKGRNKRCVWRIPTKPFRGAHFAVYSPELIETPIKAGCPELVCKKCGKPRERVYAKKEYIGPEKSPSPKYANSHVNSPGGRKHYLSEQRKYDPNQEEIAHFIKNHINGNKKILNNEFGNTTWTHWVRTDKSGAALPSPEQYKTLKKLLSLPDTYDKTMLTTVHVLVDDKGGKNEFVGYASCSCNAGFTSGIVLDPFLGSGTTAEVALKLGRRCIGIDLNPEYIKIAKRRLKSLLTNTQIHGSVQPKRKNDDH